MPVDILGFMVTLLPIIVSPGASFAIALNSTLTQGMKGLLIPIIGTGLGIMTHGLLVGIGLTKILTSYPWVMRSIGILGTLYLVYLSITLINTGLKAGKSTANNTMRTVTVKDAYLANLLNPKAIVLYLVVVSNFVGKAPSLMSFLALSSIHVLMMAAWLVISCGSLIFFSSSIQINTLRKYINIGGGILLLIITLVPYLF